MANQGGLPGQVANLVIQDYLQNGAGSAYCRYLEVFDEFYGGANPGFSGPRQLFCPPPENPPPERENIPGGGEVCRLYDVTVESINSAGSSFVFEIESVRGPVRLQRYRSTAAPNRFVGTDNVVGGDGIGCPIQNIQASGFDGIIPNEVTSTIIAVTPRDGLPDTAPPFPAPPSPRDAPTGPELNFPITVDIGGQEVNVDLQFQVPVFAPIGIFAPVFAPVSPQFDFNFNPQVTLSPRVGIDLNLEFAVNLPPSGGGDTPPPDETPVPLPPVNPPGGGPGEPFDYERIEKKIEDESCCKPVDDTELIGTFLFETPGDVYQAAVPENAEFVTIDVIPDNNSRRYKLAGVDSEIALGNASITSSGHALGYEKIFVRRHTLKVPPNLPDGGIRVSLKQGCQITVRALLHAI